MLFLSNAEDFPTAEPDVFSELLETVLGMDSGVWHDVTTSGEEAPSAVAVYLASPAEHREQAWITLCGQAILLVRARTRQADRQQTERQQTKSKRERPAKALHSRLDSPPAHLKSNTAQLHGITQRWLEPPAWNLPDATRRAEQACRDEDYFKVQTVALYAAWRAEHSSWLQETRDRLLAGQLVAHTELARFLASPAIRAFKPADFEDMGISVSRAFSMLKKDEPAPGKNRIRDWTLYFVEYNREVEREIPLGSMNSVSGLLPDNLAAAVSRIEDLPFLSGSVLDELLDASQYLAFCLLRCTLAQALSFLLTGAAPVMAPVEAQWLSSLANGGDSVLQPEQFENSPTARPLWKASHVSLTFPLWLSADVAEQAFRKVQREILGAENRPFKPQNVRMFYFVLCERRRMGIVGSGTEVQRSQIWARWNRLCQQAGASSLSQTNVEIEAAEMPNPLADLNPDWAVESFAYFNMTCNRMEDRLFPAFF